MPIFRESQSTADFIPGDVLHPPRQDPWLGGRGNKSICCIKSRLLRQKKVKRVRGSGAWVGSSQRYCLKFLAWCAAQLRCTTGSQETCEIGRARPPASRKGTHTLNSGCHGLLFLFFVCLFFVVIKPKNPYFACCPGREVNPLQVYPPGPRWYP